MTEIEQRGRRFLLVVSGALFAATAVELLLTEHYENPLQLVAFALCALGLAVVLAVWVAPRRATVQALRIGMVVVALGTLLGVYEHMAGNWAFAREVRPDAFGSDLAWSVLSGGNPLLAPGVLLLGGVLAVAATYRHPVLDQPYPRRHS